MSEGVAFRHFVFSKREGARERQRKRKREGKRQKNSDWKWTILKPEARNDSR